MILCIYFNLRIWTFIEIIKPKVGTNIMNLTDRCKHLFQFLCFIYDSCFFLTSSMLYLYVSFSIYRYLKVRFVFCALYSHAFFTVENHLKRCHNAVFVFILLIFYLSLRESPVCVNFYWGLPRTHRWSVRFVVLLFENYESPVNNLYFSMEQNSDNKLIVQPEGIK